MNSKTTPTVRRKRISRLWVPIVLLLGTILGGLLSLFIPAVEPFRRFGFRAFNEQPILQFHVVLATIEVALLIASGSDDFARRIVRDAVQQSELSREHIRGAGREHETDAETEPEH